MHLIQEYRVNGSEFPRYRVFFIKDPIRVVQNVHRRSWQGGNIGRDSANNDLDAVDSQFARDLDGA